MIALFKPNLKKIKKTNKISFLIKVIDYKEDNGLIRDAAMDKLTELGSKTLEELQKTLNKQETSLLAKQNIINVLGNIANDSTVPYLLSLLSQKNKLDRKIIKATITALGKIGSNKASGELIKILKENNEDLKKSTLWSLGRIGDDSLIPDFLLLLSDQNLQKSVLNSLINIGSSASWKAVFEAFKQNQIHEKDLFFSKIEEKGISSILKLYTPELDTLVSLYHKDMKDEKTIKNLCMKGIKKSNLEENIRLTISFFKKLSPHKDEDTKNKILELLAPLNRDKIIPFFKKIITDYRYQEYLSENALTLLIRESSQNKKEMLELLYEALCSYNSNVALTQIKSQGQKALRGFREFLKQKHSKLTSKHHKLLFDLGDQEALEEIIKDCKSNGNPLNSEAGRILADIGDKRIADYFIHYLFIEGTSLLKGGSTDWLVEDFNYLFGDYYIYIYNCALGMERKEAVSKDPLSGGIMSRTYTYYIKKMEDAVKKLCTLNTPISCNILYKITKKKEVRLLKNTGYYFPEPTYLILSFDSVKNLAKKELGARGFKEYDPDIYLSKENWKIVK